MDFIWTKRLQFEKYSNNAKAINFKPKKQKKI